MKKLSLLLVPVLLLVAIVGGVWWRYGRPRQGYAQAQAMMDRGDLRGAQLELRNVVRSSPENAAAHFRLGQVQLRLGDPVAAEKELKSARDLGFDARSIGPVMAQAYMSQGKYRELLRDFPTQGLPPDQAGQLLVLRALAQLSISDPNAALASATEAERLAPQSAEPELALARVAVVRQDFATAEQKIDRAVLLNPRSTDALILRGQLRNLRGDRTRALEAFDAALALQPNLLTARLERANLLLIGNQDVRAREDIDTALKLEPRSAMGLYLQAILLTKNKDYAAANADLDKIATILNRFPRGGYFLAVVKYNLGEAEQASDAATKYLAKNPTDPDAIKLFARIELAARRAPAAIDVLSKAVGSGNSDSEMLDLLGRAYALAGRPEQAVQSMERAAALAPDNADILARLASLRLGLGDATRATADLEHALQLSPTLAGASETLVLAAISSGEIDKATLALDRLRKQQGETEVVGNLAALIKMAQLDFAGARQSLLDLIAKFPEAVQPRLNLAKVLVLQDKPTEAEAALGEVLARQPANAAALTAIVPLLLAANQAPQATSLLEKAHAGAPKDADITVALINLYARTGDSAKATTVLDASIRVAPNDVALLTAKARLQAATGQAEQARSTYGALLDLTPQNVNVRRALAELYLSVNNPDAAKTVITEGLKLQPGNPILLQSYVAVVLKSAGLDAALTSAEQLSRDPTNLPIGAALKGDVYMGAGKFNEAAAAYLTEMRNTPSTPLLMRTVGALNAAGRSDQAAQLLRDWLQRQPSDATAAEALAGLDINARRFFDAETHLNVVLAARPSDPAALNNLAWVYQQRNDGRAQAVAQKAYLISPTPQSADTLGWILTTGGNAGNALTLLRQAASQLAGDPTVNYHLAVALNQTGHKDDAVSVLKGITQGLLDFDDRPAAVKLYEQLSQK